MSHRSKPALMTDERADETPRRVAVAGTSPIAPGERWYVVHTQPRRELFAAQQLANQGFRAFVPRHWKSRRHARRVETISAPLFPRYIFTVLDQGRDRWRSVNGTLGVDRLLMCAGEPQAVPEGLVEGLILAADADGNVRFDMNLREGQIIKIMAGPFADMVGTLEKLDDRGRVRVLLEIMGANLRVALSQALLAPG
jgi:transcription elongation factor/antiterminator RfaH